MSMQTCSDNGSLVLTHPATARLERAGEDGNGAYIEIEVTERGGWRPTRFHMQARDFESLRAVVATLQEGLERIRPIDPPATEAMAAIEAVAVEVS